MLRLPRRNPLLLLLILIPLSLLTYHRYSPYRRAAALSSAESTPLARSNVLLVSAVFSVPESKKEKAMLQADLSGLLGQISTDVYVFTTPELESVVRTARGGLPIRINTTFASPFDVPPLNTDGDLRMTYKEMNKQGRKDQIRPLHEYALSNAKPYFLAAALQNERNIHNTRADYRYAFWIDPGVLEKGHLYQVWPDSQRLDDVWKTGARESGMREEELMFFPMSSLPHDSMKHWTEGMGPVFNKFSDGSFFGGRPKAIDAWYRLYYAYHAHYLTERFFVGRDTALINSLFFLHPERIITVWPGDPRLGSSLGSCSPSPTAGYYQWWLAGLSEREDMRAKWESVWSGNWRAWFGIGESCRALQPLAMRWLLRLPFGEAWKPPTASVDISRHPLDL